MITFLTAALRPRCFVAIFALLLLGGCSSDGERTSTFPKNEPVYLSGVVASGAPWAGAFVTVKSSSNSRFAPGARATTDAQGRFRVQVNRLEAPYIIEANLDGAKIHSVAFAPGEVNVTLLTEMVVFQIVQRRTFEFFEDVATPAFTPGLFTPASLADATAKLQIALQENLAYVIPAGIGDLFTTPFSPVAGDPMDDALSALQAAFTAKGKSLLSYQDDVIAENARCNNEKVTLISGATARKFCPVSRQTAVDAVDLTLTTFTFTNAVGNTLTIRQRADAIESVALVSGGTPLFGCDAAACNGVAVGSIATDGRRQITFNSTTGTDSTGAPATLQGTLQAAKAGLPPLACEGNTGFLTISDGTILGGCSGGGSSFGGDRAYTEFNAADAEGNSIFNVHIRSKDSEVVSMTAYHFNLDTGQQIADFKCVSTACNGVIIGPLNADNTRSFSFTDTLLQEISVDGTPTGQASAAFNATFIASIAPRLDQVNCIDTSESVTATIAGERAVTVCPFAGGTSEGERGGFFLDAARTQIFYSWTNVSRRDLENSLSITVEGDNIKEVVFNIGFAIFKCNDAACGGASISAPTAAGKRNVSFSAVQLREVDIGGFPGERVAQITGSVITVSSDCVEISLCE